MIRVGGVSRRWQTVAVTLMGYVAGQARERGRQRRYEQRQASHREIVAAVREQQDYWMRMQRDGDSAD